MSDICLTIIIVCATLAVVLLTGALGWVLFNKIFFQDEGYWQYRYQREYEQKVENLKKQYDREYEKKLKDETTKILIEFYEKDKKENKE